MYAKFFFEKFWEGEQRNELFVCMPFDDSLDAKFHEVIDVGAQEIGFDRAVRVKEDWKPDVITDKIFDGIANSKMLLFDLSDDPKAPCQHSRQANLNVLYELGISNALREPEDILLIRERSSSKLPFDISGMTINEYEKDLKVKWLIERLSKAIEDQKWYKSKRVKAAAVSIDEFSLEIMHVHGSRPESKKHFHTKDWPSEKKMSVLRLMDLGILWFASQTYSRGAYEYAYRWTSFGCEVMKHLEIPQLSDEEFEKLPEYDDYKKAQQAYRYKKDKLF